METGSVEQQKREREREREKLVLSLGELNDEAGTALSPRANGAILGNCRRGGPRPGPLLPHHARQRRAWEESCAAAGEPGRGVQRGPRACRATDKREH